MFNVTGTPDTLLFAPADLSGSATGSPNSSGYIANVSWWPVQNCQLAAQYTVYTKFNGAKTNYDGSGRNASDNNTLYVLARFVFLTGHRVTGVNVEWLERNFPCKQACPVHTEAGKYVALIAEGKFREAYAVARRPNPLASICGRICAAPCESVCRRGELDAPVSIRALKRFVTERFGVESMMDFSVLTEIYGSPPDRYAEKVAVIGSGRAGLACAHDLALLGYPVTIFEAAPVAGGMLRLGVPEYRLPRALIQLEINAILSLGVELRTGTGLGTDVTLAALREQGFAGHLSRRRCHAQP